MSYTSARPSTAAAFSTINTTPLVDVMLVLLIIFMISAPLFTHEIDFKLPGKTHEVSKIITDPLDIQIHRIGSDYSYRLDGSAVDPTELMRRLRDALVANPKRGFILKADPDAGFAQVSRVMAMIRRSGLKRGSFEYNPR
jgi:biopolymer transport protein ExbD